MEFILNYFKKMRVIIVVNNKECCLARQCEDIRNEIRIAT